MSIYVSGPNRGGIPIYATLADIPNSSITGSLAVTADTGYLYEWNGSAWQQIGGPGSALSLGNLDSLATSAKGANLVAGVLAMQSASATLPGVVNTTTQSFLGNKTFLGNVIAALSNFKILKDANDVDTGAQAVIYADQDVIKALGGTATVFGTTDTTIAGAFTPLDLYFKSGANDILTSNAGTGRVFVNSGFTYVGNGATGHLGIGSGDTVSPATGNTGSTWLYTGASDAGDSGAIQIFTGAAAGTRGKITFDSLNVNLTTSNTLSGNNSGDVTLGSANGLSLIGQALSLALSSTSTTGALSSTDWNTFNGKQASGNYITALTGDATASGPGSATLTLATVNSNVGTFASVTVNAKGLVTAATALSGDATTSGAALTLATVNSNVGTFASVTVNGKGLVTAATALSGDATTSGAALTLATVNSNTGSFGSSTSIPTFTVNGKGLVTAASGNAVIAPAGTLTGTTLNSTVVTSSLTAVGTLTTGTWSATTVATNKGGTGVTSVTTSPTPSSFAGWDASANLSANSLIDGYATTATTAGTTTLVVTDSKQRYFTGTSDQTCKLPVTSTLVLGQQYQIFNNSTGYVTVVSSGSNTISTLGPSQYGTFTCILTSGTSTASWSSTYRPKVTVQKFTSGATNYTTPTSPGPTSIIVEVVGGGGGAQGGGTAGGNGTVGNSTTFGAITCNGGGTGGSGGAGGTSSGGDINIAGGSGSSSGGGGNTVGNFGSKGGSSYFGGEGGGGNNGSGNGGNGATNSGAGGGGGGGSAAQQAGLGGGGGGYSRLLINNPAASYAFSVGGTAAGGAAGTGGGTGGTGAAGLIIVTEYY